MNNKIKLLVKLNGRAEVLLCPNQPGGAATPPYQWSSAIVAVRKDLEAKS